MQISQAAGLATGTIQYRETSPEARLRHALDAARARLCWNGCDGNDNGRGRAPS